ncbi:MAG TPA: hypothetical protein VFI22_19350, partial [Thermomicrobiales bacterium]|nr:hypothetical protein [Thermomicrobiales bacterium]
AIDNDQYRLQFAPKMDGRVSDGAQVYTFEQVKSSKAIQQGDRWVMPLSEQARGKVTIGDLTILFQFVTEPPRQPKPMLPASVRGTFADRFDPRLSVILGASIIIHFAIVIVALAMDVETGDGIAERAYNLSFNQETYNVDVEQPKPDVTAQGSAAGSAEQKKPDKPAEKPAKKPAGGENTGRDAKQDVSLPEDQAAAMADLLTGEGDNGSSEGDMSKRRPGADLGQQIADVKEGGKTVAVGGGSGRGSRGNGDARVGTGKGPGINGAGDIASAGGGKGEEHAPAGRISVADKQTFDESTLTPDVVLAKIQSAYMAGLKRCYKDYLKKDPSSRGKVTLAFTVNETGRSVSNKATSGE